MIIWIIGKVNHDNVQEWEIIGITNDKIKAEIACKDENYFIGPVEITENIPNTFCTIFPCEQINWPNAYYPKKGGEEYANC